MNSNRDAPRVVAIALALVGLTFLITMGTIMLLAAGREIRTVRAQAGSVSVFEAQLAAQSVRREVDSGDSVLRAAVRAAETAGAISKELPETLDTLDEIVLQELLLAPRIADIALIDERGHPVWQSSPFPVPEQALADLTTDVLSRGSEFGLHVLVSDGMEEPAIVLSRLLSGAFQPNAQVALARLDARALIHSEEERATRFVTNTVVSDSAGTVLATRCPSPGAPCEARQSDGDEVLQPSTVSFSGDLWSATARRVPGTPLWVTTYTDFATEQAGHHRRAQILFAVGMTLGLATWILALLLQRQRAQAEHVQRAQIEALDAANDELQRVSADRALLVKEVHHRVKNNLGMIESILHLTALDADVESRALLDDVGARIEAIRGVHDALYRSEEVTRTIGLERYLPHLVEQLTESLCPFPVQVRSEITPVSITARSAIAVGIITAEVTTNAIKYGLEPGAEFTISAQRDGPMLRLAFSNTGRPYRPATEPGLGTELMHQLSAQLGGSVTVEAGERTTVVLEFPSSGCLEEEQGF